MIHFFSVNFIPSPVKFFEHSRRTRMSSADQWTFLVAGGHRRHRPRLAVDMGLHDLLGLLRVAEEHTGIQAHEPSQGFKLARSGPWGSTE